MVKAKLIPAALAALAVLSSCGPRMEWKAVRLDGSRTGVTNVTGGNVAAALGIVDSVYHAPCGKVFKGGATQAVAKSMISFQPALEHLNEVVGFCPEGLTSGRLADWTADAVLLAGGSIYNQPVDVSIVNRGGIRVDMPKGEVVLGDILAMFPFKNNIVSVKIKGADLKELFALIASGGKFAFGGARMVVKDGQVQALEIGGAPLDEQKVYTLCTIDFLLNGGDGMSIGNYALEMADKNVMISEWMVPYIRTSYAGGEFITHEDDGRLKLL